MDPKELKGDMENLRLSVVVVSVLDVIFFAIYIIFNSFIPVLHRIYITYKKKEI